MGQDPNAPPAYTSSPTSLLPLQAQLHQARAANSLTIIDTHIYPVVAARLAAGLDTTVLALIPSGPIPVEQVARATYSQYDDSADNFQASPPTPADPTEAIHIGLSGSINNAEYWQQPSAIDSLASDLRAVLENAYGSSGTAHTPAPTAPTTLPPRPKAKRGLFSSLSNRATTLLQDDDPFAGRKQPKKRAIEVSVVSDEVIVRSVSEFGLFETHTRPAVLVRVEAR
ncbi:hypothetical protein EJ06DRAFT_520460 [Trichodelitschia bisporula]|uniref:Uncharacterized protein n=1 Tax=Trichodelitschia bisporula TaxID=703511 RepID=A0A6G1I3B9_9PEZI|nr:hypothetical protein EJ06DRAFT_520460 [Trichodelitschia bisporula]